MTVLTPIQLKDGTTIIQIECSFPKDNENNEAENP